MDGNPESATGDEYCRKGDLALHGLESVEKVVDDALIHSGDYLADHGRRVREVLERCRKHHITLSAKKFNSACKEVDYVGYKITGSGISIDDNKIASIKNFARLENITGIRGFLGLDRSARISQKQLLRCGHF